MKTMKKKLTLIVVIAFTIILVLSFAGCTAPDEITDENVSEEDIADIPNEQEGDMVAYTGEGMTFEEFCVGMKGDLSDEVLEEVRELYEQWIEAEKEDDPKVMAERMEEIYEEIVDLDVLTMDEQQSQVIAKPRP